MNSLVISNLETQSVSARKLHEAVGSTERFSAWFKRQLQYGFTENEDYTTVKTFTEVENNGGIQMRELTDYVLSVDMAKHICIVQKNEKAKEVRQYLIELEKSWNEPQQVMARALLIANKQIEEKNLQIEEMTPKALFCDSVSASKDSILVEELAKLITQNGVEIGRNRLFKWFVDNGYLYIRNGYYQPMQRYVEQGLFEIKKTVINKPNGIKTASTVKITGKGQVYFINKILGEKK